MSVESCKSAPINFLITEIFNKPSLNSENFEFVKNPCIYPLQFV